MKSKHFLMMSCVTALLAGCVVQKEKTTNPRPDFCTVADPMFFNSEVVVDWLAENDPAILQRIVVHNEQVERLCP